MMRKIVTPCKCDTGRANPSTAFCKIEFQNGNLSISGVIGPYSNGDAAGSCGQCIDEIRNGTPDFGWNEKMLNRFCDIWEEWHLNDLRPYCKHQKELGWDELAKEKVMEDMMMGKLDGPDECINSDVMVIKEMESDENE